MSTRTRLGIIAITLLSTAGILFVFGHPEQSDSWKSASLRMGLISGTAWMAWPDLRRLSPWACAYVLAGVLVIFKFPKVLPWYLLLGVILYILRPRARPLR
ncbi:MAG: hypothetical protein QM811_15045 [Pirellulales bacterium]